MSDLQVYWGYVKLKENVCVIKCTIIGPCLFIYYFLVYFVLTLKEPGFLDPSHSRGGGFRPPKISGTDWRNIKCVVLVDSYDPPESIGTKKVQKYLVWRHSDVISDVVSKTRKSPKIAKIMVFRYFFAIFSSKVAFFGNDVCQSMLTHVLTPNKK